MKIDDVDIYSGAKIRCGKEVVTIYDWGRFSFSVQLVKNNHKIKLKYCVLGYSKSMNAILFLFTDDSKIQGSIKIMYRPNMGHFVINRKSFFTHYNLNIEELKGSYKLERVDIPQKGEWYAIDLNNAR